MQFSDVAGGTGILQRARKIARVDDLQWPTINVVNSTNDRLDKVFNYGRGADRRFELDDTNHTKLPIGRTPLVYNQTDYSFLTDEQNNKITNLTSISLIDSVTNEEIRLISVNRNDPEYSYTSFGVTIGTPTQYDKIADNIIKLDTLPTIADAAKYQIKYYFQRSPSYFDVDATSKEPGIANELHRGCVIQAAYDAAFTLGLSNLGVLAEELAKEDRVMELYFQNRNTDEVKFIRPVMTSAR